MSDKIRFVQFQKDRPRILINQEPDPALGPAIEVSDEQWNRMRLLPTSEWKMKHGVRVTKRSIKRTVIDYRWALLAGLAIVDIAVLLWVLL